MVELLIWHRPTCNDIFIIHAPKCCFYTYLLISFCCLNVIIDSFENHFDFFLSKIAWNNLVSNLVEGYLSVFESHCSKVSRSAKFPIFYDVFILYFCSIFSFILKELMQGVHVLRKKLELICDQWVCLTDMRKPFCLEVKSV